MSNFYNALITTKKAAKIGKILKFLRGGKYINTYPCILIQEHVNLRWVMEVRVSQSSILDKIKCHGAYILKKNRYLLSILANIGLILE